MKKNILLQILTYFQDVKALLTEAIEELGIEKKTLIKMFHYGHFCEITLRADY